MSHDKIKAAARRRVTATGEPYAAARRHVVSDHDAAQGTSAVSANDIRAAAAAHGELGPEYSDAVLASFIEQVDRAVAARVEARLADRARSAPAEQTRRGRRRLLTRRVGRDILAAGAGVLIAVGAVELHANTTPHPGAPVSRLAHAACAVRVRNGGPCFVPVPPIQVRAFLVTGDGQIKAVIAGR